MSLPVLMLISAPLGHGGVITGHDGGHGGVITGHDVNSGRHASSGMEVGPH